MMKSFSCILFLLCAFALNAEVTARLNVDAAVAGETVALELSSPDAMPLLGNQPPLENGSWAPGGGQQSQSTHIVNDKKSSTFSASYGIRAGKAGTLVIPPLQVRVGGKTETTPELRLRVVAAAEKSVGTARSGGELKLGDAVFGRIRILDKRKTFYLGEEIPVEFVLYLRDGFGIQGISYPEPEFGKVIFRDYRAVNQQDGRFAPPEQSGDIIDGVRFQKIVFRTSFRALAAGELIPAGRIRVGIPERRSRRSSPFDDDDFFGGFFSSVQSRVRPVEIDFAAAGAITVKPLPPPPAGVTVLGLVGDWEIRFLYDETIPAKVGEVLKLKIILSGVDSGETLTAPKLEVPGFRIYPAETEKTGFGGGIALSYALIPLRPGKSTIKLGCAVFNPAKEAYEVARFEKELDVAPSDRPLDAVVAGSAAPETAQPAAAENGKEPAATLIYLKPRPVPDAPQLGKYGKFWFWVLLAAGPLLFVAVEAAARRRLCVAADPARLRRSGAKKRRSEVIAKLERASNNAELGEVLNRDVAPLVCDALDLPPGLTAPELAGWVGDAEFAGAMRSAGDHAYRPGGDPAELEKTREHLIRGVKKLIAILIVLTFMGPLGAVDEFKAGAAAYDNGDFAGAIKSYETILSSGKSDPAVLFNLGCAEFMNRNYPAAIVRFEQARRLEPGDPAALENLNLARHRLGLPETGRVNSPADLGVYLRDRLRPDQWLIFAGIFWVGAWAAFAFRRTLGPVRSRIVAGTLLTLALLGGGLYFNQLATSYRSGRAFALSGGAPLKSLPGATGRAEGVVPAGHEVAVIEHRNEHSLVRYGKLHGWVENRFIRGVFEQ